MANHEH